MAREEQDREDLLGEATALIERVELRIPTPDGAAEQVVVAGFRTNGALSLYFGADPVWQFNVRGELRRAYRAGALLKAERRRLVEMVRERSDDSVILRSRELHCPTTENVLLHLNHDISRLDDALAASLYVNLGQVPEQADVVGRLRSALKRLRGGVALATSPRVE